jgi:hypothetical protein
VSLYEKKKFRISNEEKLLEIHQAYREIELDSQVMKYFLLLRLGS